MGVALGCNPPLVAAELPLLPELPPLLSVVLSGTEKLGVEVGVDAGKLEPAGVAPPVTTAAARCMEAEGEGVADGEAGGVADSPSLALYEKLRHS